MSTLSFPPFLAGPTFTQDQPHTEQGLEKKSNMDLGELDLKIVKAETAKHQTSNIDTATKAKGGGGGPRGKENLLSG